MIEDILERIQVQVKLRTLVAPQILRTFDRDKLVKDSRFPLQARNRILLLPLVLLRKCRFWRLQRERICGVRRLDRLQVRR